MTQGELEKLPAGIERAMNQLQIRIMDDIVRRIRINSFSTASADWQFTRLQQLGMSQKEIKEWVRMALEVSEEEIEKIYSDTTYEEYMKQGRGYDVYGRQQIPFEENQELQQLIDGIKKQTNEELRNITGTMGFVKKGATGGAELITLSEFYVRTLDDAMYDIHSGAFDYSTVVQRTIEDMTASGIRWIDYDSGHHNRVPVAARRAVMTGFRQVQGKINEQVARELGTDSYEVTVHTGARPTHQIWEGKVWTMEQLKNVCGLGTVTGLHGANCYHDYNAFIPGVSVRTYTDEELERIHEKENATRIYNGKEYTTYEALQRQRQLETRARKYREDVYLLEKSKDGIEGEAAAAIDEQITLKKARYQGILQEYVAFSDKMDLPTQKERIYQDGLKVNMRGTRKTEETAGNSSDGNTRRKEVLERARLIKNESDLKAISNSSIIKMSSEKDIADYFKQKYGIAVKGFENKETLGVQSPLAGYDDMLQEFPVLHGKIREISYNPRMSANGDIDLTLGKSRVGKSGLYDYGTGVHESAHMLDHIRSVERGYDYAAKILEKARKNLKLRKGTKAYISQVYQIVGLVKEHKAYEDSKEIFAFAIETAKGKVDNQLAKEIYRLVKEG